MDAYPTIPPPDPDDPADALRYIKALAAQQAATVVELASNYRDQLVAAGFSTEAAEAMTVAAHQSWTQGKM